MKVKQVPLSVIFIMLALMVSLCAFGQNINSVKPIEEERVIPSFHTLQVSGLAVVYLAQTGDTNKVKLVVSGMPIQDVLTTVKEGVLTVTTPGTHNGENIKVYVSSPIIKSITVSGAGILYSQETLKSDKLIISVNGAGAAQLAVNATELEMNMNGGDLKITGLAKRFKINNGKNYDHGTLDKSGLTVGN